MGRLPLLLLLVPSLAFADQVVLKEGQVLSGRVVEQGDQVVLQVDGGRISFAAAEVAEVLRQEGDNFGTLAERRSTLGPSDIKGRLELARWAGRQGLKAEADILYREVLELDPNQAEAHAARGDVRRDGQWLSQEEDRIARGEVRYGGRWMPKAEAAALQQDLAQRAKQRRASAPAPVPVPPTPSPSPERTEVTRWGSDLWVDGPPPLWTAGWAYPNGFGAYGAWTKLQARPLAGLHLQLGGTTAAPIQPVRPPLVSAGGSAPTRRNAPSGRVR